MEEYKKILNRRRLALVTFVLFSSIVLLFNQLYLEETITNPTVHGFQFGLLVGLEGIAIFMVIKITRTLMDERKIQLMYNAEHDERKVYIKAKAGQPMVLILSSILLFAAIIAGYYNTTVFFTLVGVVYFQLTVTVVIKMIYLKKM
ncbi:hypothetical protein [Anaerorhabdus furcosa]|uniref:Uncharacterized protein n=1 Tax=Anaerorhabdus furcosa TaxID=118967 RepID=A0A1T4NWS0_9FIRM|nr:hypothetical protein [Anaerorhabdus furcosa]SJZ83238.1 hypothetical protein SAMN02745191_1748 [Anaerorhabdus furcosa]